MSSMHPYLLYSELHTSPRCLAGTTYLLSTFTEFCDVNTCILWMFCMGPLGSLIACMCLMFNPTFKAVAQDDATHHHDSLKDKANMVSFLGAHLHVPPTLGLVQDTLFRIRIPEGHIGLLIPQLRTQEDTPIHFDSLLVF